jgi:crotonobetainyl-CoA:carnitine CoA-transferase CaiB-like acyl-CoA transferase
VNQFATDAPGMLDGVRVIEIADEQAEYCGLLIAGLGADVIKVEPPSGNVTRSIGPFYHDEVDPERSLFFWQYNRGKRSLTADLGDPDARERVLALIDAADVLLLSGDEAARLGDASVLSDRFPSLVIARVTPFGDDGPWASYRGSDLVHLALGGEMMNCGYDPDPSGHYDLPPIAPQLWHAYHVTGDQLAIGIVGALVHRLRTGAGQTVSIAVHAALAIATESDLMSWVMRRVPYLRQTCRHSAERPVRIQTVSHTKDGRWFATYATTPRDRARVVEFLARHGMAADLEPPDDADSFGARAVPGTATPAEAEAHLADVVQRFVGAHTYHAFPWLEAQEAGLLWSPVRKPHENALDPHWESRGTFADIEHPELGRTLRYPVSRWIATRTAWKPGRRAPRIGEHSVEIEAAPPHTGLAVVAPATVATPAHSALGLPFALAGVRILDFTWFLASAGATRFLASLGAECIKVEWKAHPDTRVASMAPVGGRAAREAATGPLAGVTDPDMGGQFNNKNPGKRGLSLNVAHPRGLEIARELVRRCDVVAEGFSPGVMERWGLGYEALRELRPDVIYAKQSGMGGHGAYGRMRAIGPVAAALAGTTEMSGLAEPALPAGWGYSYLDWIGAYSLAIAILGAIFHRARTGEGQWIDASQTEAGIYIGGTAVLDWSANGRVWSRTGNRSPYRPAAPHGAYRCAGEDRWIAIACFEDEDWHALAGVIGDPSVGADARFATLDSRLAHQDELDQAVQSWTATQDAYAAMHALQAAGVPAGVCQTAEDRCERDPQLAALGWLTELEGTKIGRWPVVEMAARLSATPGYAGGPIDRGAPCYGEDNVYVLGALLGLDAGEIADLAEQGVI